MSKFLYLSVCLLILQLPGTHAQVPQKFSFQGAARNAAGKVVANKNVGVRFTIRPGSATGTSVYQETHTAQTNAQGVFTVSIGGGAVQSGEFTKIDWPVTNYFLQMELDADGIGNYIDMGANQLLSVPYALHAQEATRLKNGDPIIQEGRYTSGAVLPVFNWENAPTRFLWYPRRGALRFGFAAVGSDAWSDINVGDFSFAGGHDAVAHQYSFAFGSNAKALGGFSLAIGPDTKAVNRGVALGYAAEATGEYSLALGRLVNSMAKNAIAIGHNLQSRSMYGMAIGVNNDVSDPLTDDVKPEQRLFQVGNGNVEQGTRSNALTILRNGNVGIGNNALAPTHILDVGHRMRLRSNPGYTAGIWLDNTDAEQYSFIGGKNNDEAGIYFEPGGWVFSVNKNGTAKIANALVQTSDLRLKQDLQPLTGSLAKLYELKGYHYHWKDKTRSQALQTGVIAQEVLAVFPELVETDKDGLRSVNYIGLIPHLIEAVKELKRENEVLKKENQSLSQETKRIELLERKIEQVEARINGNNNLTNK